MPVTKANVADVFTYHAPGPDDPLKYMAIRTAGKALAEAILEYTPHCADQQAAIRLVREACFTANGAIALKGAV